MGCGPIKQDRQKSGGAKCLRFLYCVQFCDNMIAELRCSFRKLYVGGEYNTFCLVEVYQSVGHITNSLYTYTQFQYFQQFLAFLLFREISDSPIQIIGNIIIFYFTILISFVRLATISYNNLILFSATSILLMSIVVELYKSFK